LFDERGKVGMGITPGTEQLKVKGDTAITGKFSLGQLIANYDSGWFDVEINKNYKKEHNLGTFLLVTQILFKDINGRIWDAKTTLRRVNDGDFQNSYCGYYLLMPDHNTFDFATAGQAVFAADNTSTYGMERKSQRFTKGSYRIFAWRIGATLNE
jgi:hypothetical protein